MAEINNFILKAYAQDTHNAGNKKHYQRCFPFTLAHGSANRSGPQYKG
jgi:hypothetical protein